MLLRGLNQWDSDVLAPFIYKLQMIATVDNVDSTRTLVKEMQDTIVINVCAGVASRVDIVMSLLDAIDQVLLLYLYLIYMLNLLLLPLAGLYFCVGLDFVTLSL
jgi:phage shock protein PspC (stress-responsive transcriptional regulator)